LLTFGAEVSAPFFFGFVLGRFAPKRKKVSAFGGGSEKEERAAMVLVMALRGGILIGG
jgi:hypothetical protein